MARKEVDGAGLNVIELSVLRLARLSCRWRLVTQVDVARVA